MKRFFSIRSFSTRLVIGFVVLILLTTLSAGIPAYWLTRAQLERQARSQVDNAQKATQSLIQAEQNRLTNQVVLFAERPTLQRLAREQATDELQPYLRAFQSQSRLDMLLFCDAENQPLAGDVWLAECDQDTAQGFTIFGDQPAFLARQRVEDEATGRPLGVAVAGVWLDDHFLQQLTADTGMQQSILRPDGVRLSSTFPGTTTIGGGSIATAVVPFDQRTLTLNGGHYYAAYAPLADGAGQIVLMSEVALDVNALVATEQSAFFILAGSTGLVAVLGIGLSIWFVRQVSAPLQKLTATAEQISQGDLLTPIPLFSDPAEIRTLAAALHQSQASMLQALQERSEVGERLNTLVQSIVEGVVTFDAAGRVTFWSQGAESLLGWEQNEVTGRHINTVFPLADGDKGQFLDQIPAAGQKKQISALTRTGKSVVLAVTGARLIPPGGDTAQVALVVRDVTEEEAVRRLRSYFLANISHEFRTPLSTLNASMELLLDEQERFTLAEVQQLLKPTHVSLLSLQTLIDNLLESSSIEAGRFTLRRRPFHMNEAVTNALNIARPLLERRNQSLSLAVPPELPEIGADPARLTQVLVNLIINASKYGPIGQAIDMQVEQLAATLHTSVADRGPGIPPAERRNLFRSFVRLDTANQEQYGIGLGLYVVKTIVEAHGGQVGVRDRPGGGSIFWFELPLEAPGE